MTPYRGIQPFRYVDHRIFFAREEETRQLASLVTVYRGVMLYGDSGTGKSSLINAGLLPEATRLGFHPERLRVQPRTGQELVIERIATAEDEAEFVASLLAPEEDGPARATLSMQAFEERLRAACEVHRPLIVFDQFEEILTLFEQAGARETQERLLELIVALLREPLPIKLLFAFREDYLGKVKQLLAPCPELVDQALRLTSPEADTLPTIIRGPFERYPGRFARELSPEVTDRLSTALAERFGSGDLSLSEVQTVCLRLWQTDEPEVLLAAKGPQGLLEDYLGESLEAFSPELRAAAIALLGQMVTSGGTRNFLSAEDLIQRTQDSDNIPPALSERALERLEHDSKLVRRERRRDLDLYEITSEFLLPWIGRRQEESRRLQDRARDRGRLRILGSLTAGLVLIVVFLIVFISSRDDPEAGVRTVTVQVGERPVGVALTEGEAWVTDSEGNKVWFIKSTFNSQEAPVDFPVGERPDGVAVEKDGTVWVANSGDDSVSRLGRQTNYANQELDVGASPGGIAVKNHSVWVANGGDDTVSKLRTENGLPVHVGRPVDVGNKPYGVTVDRKGAIWVTNGASDSVSRIPPGSLTAGKEIPVGDNPKGIDATGAWVWVANTGDDTVFGINRHHPRTPARHRCGRPHERAECLRVFENVGDEPRGVWDEFGSIWVTLGEQSQVARLDPTDGNVVQTIDVGDGPNGIVAGTVSVWVASGDAGTVSRISPASGDAGTVSRISPVE